MEEAPWYKTVVDPEDGGALNGEGVGSTDAKVDIEGNGVEDRVDGDKKHSCILLNGHTAVLHADVHAGIARPVLPGFAPERLRGVRGRTHYRLGPLHRDRTAVPAFLESTIRQVVFAQDMTLAGPRPAAPTNGSGVVNWISQTG
ncbi:hypothetical protein AURDEDRAFT_168935 [Auricularia subglabra TFB-10046 SS5]|nr:hypothetical protein AURDEDRAFT_168935 [Auricularia subglabra TFB-10046 SS5]